MMTVSDIMGSWFQGLTHAEQRVVETAYYEFYNGTADESTFLPHVKTLIKLAEMLNDMEGIDPETWPNRHKTFYSGENE